MLLELPPELLLLEERELVEELEEEEEPEEELLREEIILVIEPRFQDPRKSLEEILSSGHRTSFVLLEYLMVTPARLAILTSGFQSLNRMENLLLG